MRGRGEVLVHADGMLLVHPSGVPASMWSTHGLFTGLSLPLRLLLLQASPGTHQHNALCLSALLPDLPGPAMHIAGAKSERPCEPVPCETHLQKLCSSGQANHQDNPVVRHSMPSMTCCDYAGAYTVMAHLFLLEFCHSPMSVPSSASGVTGSDSTRGSSVGDAKRPAACAQPPLAAAACRWPECSACVPAWEEGARLTSPLEL